VDKKFPTTYTIRGGDWDLKVKKFEKSTKFRYIKKYHESNKVPNKKEVVPEWQTSEQHLIKYERLYQSIKKNGFKTQEEVSDGKGVLNEINILIGRDGKLIVKSGFHRVSIAKVLNLDSVPIYIKARHEDWQRLRDEAWRTSSVEQLSTEVRRHHSHPDIHSAIKN